MNPPVATESTNRTTDCYKEAFRDVKADVEGADIGRDGRSGDEEREELRSTLQGIEALGTISGIILNMLIFGETLKSIIYKK